MQDYKDMNDAMKGRSANPGSGGLPMKIALRSRPAERLRGAAPLVVAAVLGSATAALAHPRTAAITSGAAPRTRLAGRERSAIFMGDPPLAGLAERPFISSRVCL